MYIMIDQSKARVCCVSRVVRGTERIDGIINGFCEWIDNLVGRW